MNPTPCPFRPRRFHPRSARAWRFELIDDSAAELLGEIELFPRSASARVPLAEADRAQAGYWLRSDRTGNGFVIEGFRR